MSNKLRLFIVVVISAALLGLFGWTPQAYVWFPAIKGNEKIILAAIALLTTMAFAYSDSTPPTGLAETKRKRLEARRDFAKLITHALAIVTAGYALALTIRGVL